MSTQYRDAVLADNPVAYWRFNEASGNFEDETANNLDATPKTGVLRQQTNLLGSATNGYAANVGTAGGIGNAGTNVLFDFSNDFTVEFWMKRPNTTAGTYGLITKGNLAGGTTTLAYAAFIDGSNRLSFRCSADGTTINTTNSPAAALNNTTTHHCVITYTKATTTVRMYIDNVLVTTNAAGPASIFVSPRAFRIGMSTDNTGNDGSPFTNGTMDEVAVYATALSAVRISAHYVAAPKNELDAGRIASTSTVRASYIRNVGSTFPFDMNNHEGIWEGRGTLGYLGQVPFIEPFDYFLITSDFHASTNQKAYAYRLGANPGALTASVVYGPYTLPSNTIYCAASRERGSLWYGASGSTIYKMDTLTGVSTLKYTAPGGGFAWRIYWYDDSTVYAVFARAGTPSIAVSTDAGETWAALPSTFDNAGGNNSAFAEVPTGITDICRIGNTLYTVHTAKNLAGSIWGVSSGNLAGTVWNKIVGTFGTFQEGGRGTIKARGSHIIYMGEGFNDFVAGDASTPSTSGLPGGNSASDAYLMAFFDGTALIRGDVTTNATSDYAASWGNTVPAPAGTGPVDVMHKASVRSSDNYGAITDWGSQTIRFTTDKGANWQSIATPDWPVIAAFVGGD